MASYKVPQDVEADDKLIGPFSFRQFVYIIIVVMAGALAWGLAQLFIVLAILPLPIMLFFGALALPLRKDQPMEIYMAAMVSYFLKPRKRLWDADGVDTLIQITAPKTVEVNRTKDLSQNEAEQRLSYLANIVDSGGWAIRGVGVQAGGTSLNNDIYLEAQGAQDILDTNTGIAQNFDQMMTQSTARMHEEAKARMMQAGLPQPPVSQPLATQMPLPQAVPQAPQAPHAPQISTMAQQYQPAQPAQSLQPVTSLEDIEFNPYPTFHQSVIQPLNDTAHQAKNDIVQQTQAQPQQNAPQITVPPQVQQISAKETPKDTSGIQLTADIINLANNPDISIETIAHEAHRIHKKAQPQESDEVIISLR